MATIVEAIAIAAGAAAVAIALGLRGWRVWRRYSAARIVTCPETSRAAAVQVDVRRATLSSFLEADPTLVLCHCSRWPERGRCAEPCVPQIRTGEARPVPEIVHRWFDGRTCAYCATVISDGPSGSSRAALRGADGATIEWRTVPPERLVAMLQTHQAVCWNCHVAETFRRVYPDLVVDRPIH
jgi:hypothetical protein